MASDGIESMLDGGTGGGTCKYMSQQEAYWLPDFVGLAAFQLRFLSE
jgi:hypothetical protein